MAKETERWATRPRKEKEKTENKRIKKRSCSNGHGMRWDTTHDAAEVPSSRAGLDSSSGSLTLLLGSCVALEVGVCSRELGRNRDDRAFLLDHLAVTGVGRLAGSLRGLRSSAGRRGGMRLGSVAVVVIVVVTVGAAVAVVA